MGLCACSGQHLLPALLGGGADKAALEVLANMQDLYRGHSRDAGDTMMLAFEAGTYTQVPGAVILPHFSCTILAADFGASASQCGKGRLQCTLGFFRINCFESVVHPPFTPIYF